MDPTALQSALGDWSSSQGGRGPVPGEQLAEALVPLSIRCGPGVMRLGVAVRERVRQKP